MASEEHPLYRRTEPDSELTPETYIALPEPELDQDGRELGMVEYQSTSGGRRD